MNPYRALLFVLAFLGIATQLLSSTWWSEPIGYTEQDFDRETGLPLIDKYGRPQMMVPGGFRPRVLPDDGRFSILRYAVSDTPEPPEYDPETGLPVTGFYFQLEVLELLDNGEWSDPSPVTLPFRELTSPGMVTTGSAAHDFALYYLEDSSLVVKSFSNGTPDTRVLPLSADDVAVAVHGEDTIHAVWRDDAGLRHGYYDDGSWTPGTLEASRADAYRLKRATGTAAHVVYSVSSEGDEDNFGTATMVYRSLQSDGVEAPEIIHDSLNPIEHFDLATGANGHPIVAFVDPVNTEIRLARRNGPDDWSVETVSQTSSDYGPVTLTHDAQGEPGIAFAARTGRELGFARRGADGWSEEIVAESEYSGFFFGLALVYREEDVPMIVSAESERHVLKVYSPSPVAPRFPTITPTIEMKRAHILEWEGDTGFDPSSRLEWTSQLSDPASWQPYDDAEITSFTTDDGRTRFRATIEDQPEPIFFRAIVTTAPED